MAEMWQVIQKILVKNRNFIRIAYRFNLFCAHFLMLALLIYTAGFVSKIIYFATEENLLLVNTYYKLRNSKRKIYCVKRNANLVAFYTEKLKWRYCANVGLCSSFVQII
jgi:hypothetical protein